ncbi:coiled-coil-helix-coiled-coil-helix domain-containing protein 10, mitochondrial-like [Drosophila guanche]|uniref:Blast:Coiled-coil-helix-coiled-coil-helix domain-containing protein 10, mitochondrial n=1 Tax=Drosophila guanche TaxID=7266 RepID=A0A3B0KB98_DROGU|nr:coiled-coil-helix-coiled-coil-helix domain-containing protein 10, mitochondrial-like [Drosophila guanche]SPP80848.1 blast:Coiled-coil-helix-coiled-coil-helix domain-containing protein 10%2C mitochondrial [Drosophila guanche]
MPRQRSDKSSGSARHQSSRSNTSCTIPVPNSRARNSQLPAVSQTRKQQSTPAPAKDETKAAAKAPAAEVAPKESGKGSLFKDMAATAAGVAAGSAVGHVVGAGISSLFGGGGGNSVPANQPAEQAAPPVAVQAQRTSELVDDSPCAYELRQFLKCTEENSDLTACQGFNEAMKECRRRYNI